MADYAWSHIKAHVKDGDGTKLTRIKPGSEVSAEKLGMTKEEYAELLENGSVRKDRWPKGLSVDNPASDSPNVHRLKQLNEEHERLAAEAYTDGGTLGAAFDDDDEDKGNDARKSILGR